MNPDTIGCVWTGEFNLNTQHVDGKIFESGKKKLQIQKYLDTCGRGPSRHATDPSVMWTPLYQGQPTWSQRNQNSCEYLLCTILCPVLSCCLITFMSALLFLLILLLFVWSFTVLCGPVCGKIRLLVFFGLHWFTCCTLTFSDLAEVHL